MYWFFMTILMRLVSLILIVAALVFLGADTVSSLEGRGDLTVRSLNTIWSMLDAQGLNAFKNWVQNMSPAMAQALYSALALPAWAVTGVLGVILAFVFGRRLGPE